MLIIILAFSLCLAKYEKEWEEFKTRFGKNYEYNDEKHRFSIFKDNINYAKLLNRIDKSATYGITKFSDLTQEEFTSIYTNYIPMTDYEMVQLPSYKTDLKDTIPDAFDWTTVSGVINKVQDQGSCGSCWSFASTSVLESVYAINNNKLYKLSEQQLVDCDSTNSGCNGGNLSLAAMYLKKNGQTTEDKYPYVGIDQTCKSFTPVVKLSSYKLVVHDEDEMRKALFQNGPLAIAINANPVQFYTGGVLRPSVCSPSGINHAVVAVGYDIKAADPYWKIRNSWGSSWGESGYFRLYYGENTCGVSEDVLTYFV